jgi:SNF2 family DNA or RNA helicase
VNYELPWNPMVVEQRIGRIHRIGQTREAHIISFAAAGTIESHILRILDQKIQLFLDRGCDRAGGPAAHEADA